MHSGWHQRQREIINRSDTLLSALNDFAIVYYKLNQSSDCQEDRDYASESLKVGIQCADERCPWNRLHNRMLGSMVLDLGQFDAEESEREEKDNG